MKTPQEIAAFVNQHIDKMIVIAWDNTKGDEERKRHAFAANQLLKVFSFIQEKEPKA
jgi:hypothetical protein